ncbi:MAG: cytochrome b/b6 domain-containing protein, partial [Planctomycetes bacterium]|nr:cytochrome b/b6 domain-containing protein [Planctomycetota bacterium]
SSFFGYYHDQKLDAYTVLGGSQNTKMLHDFGMWLFVVFAILHIYMAIRADFMGRQSSVRTIIDGWRRYKD